MVQVELLYEYVLHQEPYLENIDAYPVLKMEV